MKSHSNYTMPVLSITSSEAPIVSPGDMTYTVTPSSCRDHPLREARLPRCRAGVAWQGLHKYSGVSARHPNQEKKSCFHNHEADLILTLANGLHYTPPSTHRLRLLAGLCFCQCLAKLENMRRLRTSKLCGCGTCATDCCKTA